jgi:uncharacterized protein (TIGR03067 family)
MLKWLDRPIQIMRRVSDGYHRMAQFGWVVTKKHALMACVIFAELLSLATVWPAEEQGKKDPLAVLQGGWKVTGLEIDGKPSELPAAASFWLVIKDNKVFYGGQELAKLTCDPTTTPPCLDLAFRKPDRVYEAAYSVEGNTLKVCVNHLTEGVKERPTSFSTEGKPDWRLLVFQRDMDRKIEDLEGLAGFVGLMIMSQEDSKELMIKGVMEGSPAKKADLKKEDVLLKISGQAPPDLQGAVKMIRYAKPGSELEVRVRRGDKELDVTVKVGVAPFFLLD